MSGMYDVVVIGAGPVGSRVAEIVAKKGYKVALIEKNREVGLPVHCTGLVSHRLKALVPDLPENVILNKINRAKFFSASSSFELKSKPNQPFYVVDREKLDKFLFLRARQAGATAETSVLFRGIETYEEDFLIVSTSKGKVQTKILVGADGAASTVASAAGLERPANMLVGVQTTVLGEFDADVAELIFSSELTPDFFGWVVPLSAGEARIGVAAKKDMLKSLKLLVEKRTDGKIKASSVKPDSGGSINFGLMERTSAEHVMVVGDAACHVKPFSGGGVVYGLMGAGFCANACIKALRENDFSADFFKREYDEKWKSHLGGPIKRGLLYRRILLGSDRRMNFLFNLGKFGKIFLEKFDVDLL